MTRKKMKEINPDFAAAIAAQVNTSPYFELISMSLASLSWGEAVLRIGVEHKHLQPFGVAHGGVCAALVDAAAFWAVFSQVPEKRLLTTVELKLNFLAPVFNGDLVGTGKCIKVGNQLGLGEASVVDASGRLAAHGTSTVMILDSLPADPAADMPPKYL
jgi:uncharacterized protein (TIGR00369 family)